jgi:phage tail sheath gpL-like
MQFNFNRNPSTKVGVGIETSGLVSADNELVIVGRRAASGGSATNHVPAQIENYGDPVAAKAEADALFGADSELGAAIVAAIKGVKESTLLSKKFPSIKAIAIASNATSAALAAALQANPALPMPFLALPFPLTDSAALTAAKAHMASINGDDRGDNGQFGSFAVLATDGTLSAATTSGEAAASESILAPWLRDTGSTKANPIHCVAAAYAAVCASIGVPFLPLNGVKVGGLLPPSAADYHTSGDAGSVALGLDSGLVPLTVGADGAVKISRSITTYRPVAAVEADSYYDMQDWQVLFYYRKNAYALAQQPRYAVAKATDQKLLSLKSELISLAKDFEAQEMFQYVDKLVSEFKVNRVPSNRHASVYQIPVNVVPGFMNKGVGLLGTNKYDSFTL